MEGIDSDFFTENWYLLVIIGINVVLIIVIIIVAVSMTRRE
jgi:hypothetical protein